jgi:hypothetical protein
LLDTQRPRPVCSCRLIITCRTLSSAAGQNLSLLFVLMRWHRRVYIFLSNNVGRVEKPISAKSQYSTTAGKVVTKRVFDIKALRQSRCKVPSECVPYWRSLKCTRAYKIKLCVPSTWAGSTICSLLPPLYYSLSRRAKRKGIILRRIILFRSAYKVS